VLRWYVFRKDSIFCAGCLAKFCKIFSYFKFKVTWLTSNLLQRVLYILEFEKKSPKKYINDHLSFQMFALEQIVYISTTYQIYDYKNVS